MQRRDWMVSGTPGWRVVAWLVLAALLASCSREHDAVLRFGLASAPLTLDPRYATDATSARINRLLYQRLVEFDAALRPVPGIAQWDKISPTHYRFTLRPDRAPFHDGSVLTPRDVKATYDSVLDVATVSPHRATLAMIERIDAPDDEHIDFYLAKPDALFPGRLVIGIVPASALRNSASLARSPVGSGPFVFGAWPEEGRLQLVRRADEQALEFLTVKDSTVRVLKLLRGEIDMVQNDLPPEMISYARRHDALQVLTARGSNFSYLGFNLRDPVVGDERVRHAIAYGIDRDAIIHYMLADAARPASALLAPDHWAGAPQLAGYAYDPERARALLREAGYSNERRPQLEYKTSSDAFRVRLATVIQQQLQKIGVDIALKTYDWGTFYGDIKSGQFQVFSLSWIGVKTPDIFRYAFHTESVPPQGANRGRYSDAQTDRLIDVADASDDAAIAAENYRALQARLLETLPYVPLWYEDHVFIARRDITGYHMAHDGNYDGLVDVRRGAGVKP